MTIFDQLKDIIVEKNNILSEDTDLEKDFIPFMMQRWLSFYSHPFTQLVNISSNRLWRVFDDKQLWYKLFLGIIPKSKFKSIKYIKKNQEHKSKLKIDNDIIKYIAERMQLSCREVKQYIQLDVIDIKLLKKQLEEN